MYRAWMDKPYSGRFKWNEPNRWHTLAGLLDDLYNRSELLVVLGPQFTLMHWQNDAISCIARFSVPQPSSMLLRRVSDGFKSVAALSDVEIHEPSGWRFTADRSGWYSLDGEFIAPVRVRDGSVWLVAGEGRATWSGLSEQIERAARGVLLAEGMSFALDGDWYWYRSDELLVAVNRPSEHWQGWLSSVVERAMKDITNHPRSSLSAHLARYGVFGLVELTCEEFCYLVDSGNWLENEPGRALFDSGEPITSRFDEISEKFLGGRKPVYVQYLDEVNCSQVYGFARAVSEREVIRGVETQARVYLVPSFSQLKTVYAEDGSWITVGAKVPLHPFAVRDASGVLLLPVPGHWGLRNMVGALPFILARFHVRPS